jgi:hypothetical protein
MKRILLLFPIFVFALAGHLAVSQCVPNTSITVPGIYPDSATGLVSGTVGVPYSEVIQAKVLTDTSLGGAPVIITNVTVTSVSGLPPGLSYSCNPASCVFPGGSNGCMLISGTPTTAGVYPLTVVLTANGTIFGIPVPPQSSTLSYYKITIDSPTGIAEGVKNIRFDFINNQPNPASGYTDLTFVTPTATDVTIKLFNVIGSEVMTQKIRGMAGSNTTRINLDGISPGIYMITMDNGSAVISRRMIVSRP